MDESALTNIGLHSGDLEHPEKILTDSNYVKSSMDDRRNSDTRKRNLDSSSQIILDRNDFIDDNEREDDRTANAVGSFPLQNVFIPRDIKKSVSFGGYGLLPGLNKQDEVTFADLRLLVEEGKKEPTKTTKQKIKDFAAKYKDFKAVGVGRVPWYRSVQFIYINFDHISFTRYCVIQYVMSWRECHAT